MSGVNKQILVGRLGKDPEARNLDNGAMVATFSVATSETWKDKTTGEKKESTEWHNVVCWRGLAEIASRYLKKGNMVYIEGKTCHRKYQAKDGSDRYITEVVADQLVMLSSPSGSSSNNYSTPSGGHQQSTSTSSASNVENPAGQGSDDLPF